MNHAETYTPARDCRPGDRRMWDYRLHEITGMEPLPGGRVRHRMHDARGEAAAVEYEGGALVPVIGRRGE